MVKLTQKLPHFVYDPTRGRFRSWLKTVVRHAIADFVAERQKGETVSNFEAYERLSAAPAQDDLDQELEEEFDKELLEVAKQRVRQRVDPKTWECFRLLTEEGLTGREVAARLGMKVANVYHDKSRVLEMLKEEVNKLRKATD